MAGRRLAWAACFVPSARAAFALVPVEALTARTTLRLWHDLYVARATAHDFEHLFTPVQDGQHFVAAVLNDEVCALARCDAAGPSPAAGCGFVPLPRRAVAAPRRLLGVAHAPECSEAASALVRLLAEGDEDVRAHPQLRTRQPRWAIALAFFARE